MQVFPILLSTLATVLADDSRRHVCLIFMHRVPVQLCLSVNIAVPLSTHHVTYVSSANPCGPLSI